MSADAKPPTYRWKLKTTTNAGALASIQAVEVEVYSVHIPTQYVLQDVDYNHSELAKLSTRSKKWHPFRSVLVLYNTKW